MGFNIPKIVISSILVTRIYISHSLTAREFGCWRQNKCKEGFLCCSRRDSQLTKEHLKPNFRSHSVRQSFVCRKKVNKCLAGFHLLFKQAHLQSTFAYFNNCYVSWDLPLMTVLSRVNLFTICQAPSSCLRNSLAAAAAAFNGGVRPFSNTSYFKSFGL